MNRNTIKKIKEFAKKQEYIELCYLFGSMATGKNGPLSDIDIAFYLNPKLTKTQMYEKELFLITEMCGILNRNKVDVVIMNEVPLLLNYNIIKEGKLLYYKTERKKVMFETKIISMYLDQDYYETRHINSFIKYVARHGII